MLNITLLKNPNNTFEYHKDLVITDVSDPEKNYGQWYGSGVATLGLEKNSTIREEHFQAFLHNQHPHTKKKLTPIHKKGRRIAYDFTFSVDKSYSIIWGLSKNKQHREQMKTLFQNAINYTLDCIEKEVQVRVRKQQANYNRNAGNLIAAQFLHSTSRAVDKQSDMHLHQHALVFNASYDAEEQCFKAIQLGEVLANASYYESLFLAKLAYETQKVLGYPIQRKGNYWTISSIPTSLQKKFSRRTEQVEAYIQQQQLTKPRQKAKAGLKSRTTKGVEESEVTSSSLAFQQQQLQWWNRLNSEEKEILQKVTVQKEKKRVQTQFKQAVQALELAKEHCFERLSVVSKKMLLREALRLGYGKLSPEIVHQQVQTQLQQGQLLHRRNSQKNQSLQIFLTTPEVVQAEKKLLQQVQYYQQKIITPIISSSQLLPANILKELHQDQKESLQLLTQSTNACLSIVGKAGTGKTRLLETFQKLVKQYSTQSIIALAPTAQSRKSIEVLGIKSYTVARFLQDTSLQKQLQGQILWLDEVGLLGVQTMNQVVNIVRQQRARIILSGDYKQLHSIEAGDAFRLLHEYTNIEKANLHQIKRQQVAYYQQAVSLISQGKVKEGIHILDHHRCIQEYENKEELYQQIAQQYVQQGADCLVVAPTHKDCRYITKAIREKRKALKQLSTKEIVYCSLQNVSLTKVEQRQALSYEPEMILHFHQPVINIQKGKKYVVVQVRSNSLVLQEYEPVHTLQKEYKSTKRKQSIKNCTYQIPLSKADAFTVYKPQQIALAQGDTIRITKNECIPSGSSNKKSNVSLINGEHYHIKKVFTNGDVLLNTGVRLPRQFGFFTHGYAVTTMASQGKTVNHVICCQTTLARKAISLEGFYVAVSRGRMSVKVFTDDKEVFLEAVQHSNQRLAALELLQQDRTVFSPSTSLALDR